ncbi:hypothetical protein Q7P36_002810 [Cladosporium allicinum]
MYAVADWGAYTHEHPHLTSNESDLELIQASDVYDYATHEPVITSPRHRPSDEDPRDGFYFDEAFRSDDSPTRSHYPSLDNVGNQSLPYPVLASESEPRSVGYGSADGAEVDVDWRNEHPHELGLTPSSSPSQRTTGSERNPHPSIEHGRNDSGIGTSIGPSTHVGAAGKEPHDVAQDSPGLGLDLARAQEDVPHTTNPFPVDTSQYVPGNGISEKQNLHDEVGDMASVAAHVQVAAPEEFPCTDCTTIWKTNGDLKYVAKPNPRSMLKANTISHHRLIHDPEWKHRLLCPQCGQGFRYPKDLGHHVNAHNGVRYACADCPATYARPDGRLLHLRRKGHTAA